MTASQEYLREEADRCLICKNALCQRHCPINTPVPEVFTLYKEGKIEEAGEMLFENNPFSSICGVICPVERLCLGNCILGRKGRPIDFYQLEEFISGEYIKNLELKAETSLDDRIAIVGSGPAGITISLILARRGYKVTLFEANDKIGGVLRYGIPDFRFDKSILDKMHDLLIDLGVKIRPNTLIGPVLTIDKLFNDGYKAIFIGTGVWNPRLLDIPGESLGNSHYAIDYLKTPKAYDLGKKVVVIGAGNVAMDSARTAKLEDSDEVIVLYRKDFEDMSATPREIKDAKEEGVLFETFKTPVEITDEGVIYRETRKEVDEEGKERWVEVEGSDTLLECDSIIIAASQRPKNNIVINNIGFATDPTGLLVTYTSGHTTREGVFASGDVVTGSKTAVEAVAGAKLVAEAIDEYCKNLKENKTDQDNIGKRMRI